MNDGTDGAKVAGMKQRRLGTSGPQISAIGLGCMGMSEFYGPSDEATSIQVIHHALERGVNLFDTADMYGSGHNEEHRGRALAGRRDRAVIATKFAVVRGEGGAFVGVSGKPDYVRAACEASLRRLKVETIDLYYQHRVDRSVPIEDTVGAMAGLVAAGKVRHLGLSEAAPATIRRAHAVHPIAALQTELSLWSRDPEGELLDTCAELGITFVAYSPLGRGFLTGAVKSVDDLAANDFRRMQPRFTGDNLATNRAMVGRIEELAAARGCTAAQLALAWVIGHPNTVAIPGTRRLARLDENVAAAEIELTREELAALDAIAPRGAAAGPRYPEMAMSTLNG
jgi:aryl-alcohol dehydrogenase-like predicted oxidoreductase